MIRICGTTWVTSLPNNSDGQRRPKLMKKRLPLIPNLIWLKGIYRWYGNEWKPLVELQSADRILPPAYVEIGTSASSRIRILESVKITAWRDLQNYRQPVGGNPNRNKNRIIPKMAVDVGRNLCG